MVVVVPDCKTNNSAGTSVDDAVLVSCGAVWLIPLICLYRHGRRLLCRASAQSKDEEQASQKYKLIRLHSSPFIEHE